MDVYVVTKIIYYVIDLYGSAVSASFKKHTRFPSGKINEISYTLFILINSLTHVNHSDK